MQKTSTTSSMIVHNEANGETCWFQTKSDDIVVALDGENVPGPAEVRDHDFWVSPAETADIACVRCHDSSPFMVSPWIRRAVGNALDDKRFHPYRNSEKPFDRWPKPRFVRVKKAGLKQGDASCTSCHKIAVQFDESIRIAGYSAKRIVSQTCTQWIDWTTGYGTIPGQNTTRARRRVWMPDSGDGKFGTYHRRDFRKRYRKHLAHLKKCCKALGAVKPGEKVSLNDCEEWTPKVRNGAP